MNNKRRARLCLTLLAACLTGCQVAQPTAPSVVVLPPPDKPYARFDAENRYCRRSAYDRMIESGDAQAASQNATTTAAVGVAEGVVIGGLFGSAFGRLGAGAAIGGGEGLLVGSAAAGNQASNAAEALQRKYDIIFLQCMASYGNRG